MSSNIDVRAIAALARVELNDEEAVEFQQEIDAILGYVEQISSLDLADVEPTARAVELINVYRDDKAGETMNRDIAMANAPATVDDELFRVPVVLDGGE